MTDLAKRGVACKGWRWMPGMLAIHPDWRGFRVSHVGLTGMHGVCRYPSPMGGVERAVVALPVPTSSDVLPDLTDPATLGCLLVLVREAWDVGYGENKYAYIAVNPPVTPHMGEPWSVVVCDHNGEWPFGFDGDTEAEALIEALEAAP